MTHRRALSSPAPARRCEVLAPREGTRVIPPCRSSTMRVSRLKGGNQEEEEFIIQFGYGINDYWRTYKKNTKTKHNYCNNKTNHEKFYTSYIKLRTLFTRLPNVRKVQVPGGRQCRCVGTPPCYGPQKKSQSRTETGGDPSTRSVSYRERKYADCKKEKTKQKKNTFLIFIPSVCMCTIKRKNE